MLAYPACRQMESKKTPFGFLILGALAGAAFGAVYSDVMHRPLAVALGSILGVFGGLVAERCYVRLSRFDALLVAIIVLVLILLLVGPTPPAYPE